MPDEIDQYAIGPRADDEALTHVRSFADSWRSHDVGRAVIRRSVDGVTLTIDDLKAVLDRLEDIEGELGFVRARATEH